MLPSEEGDQCDRETRPLERFLNTVRWLEQPALRQTSLTGRRVAECHSLASSLVLSGHARERPRHSRQREFLQCLR